MTPTCSCICTPRIPTFPVPSAQPEPFGEHVRVPHSSSLTFVTQEMWLWCLTNPFKQVGAGRPIRRGAHTLACQPGSLLALGGHAISLAAPLPSASFPRLLPAQGFKSTWRSLALVCVTLRTRTSKTHAPSAFLSAPTVKLWGQLFRTRRKLSVSESST